MKDKKPSAERLRTKRNGSSPEKALSSRKLPGARRVNEGAALQIWKQIDDVLVPRLRLSVI